MKRFTVILLLSLALLSACRQRTGYLMVQGYAQGGTYTVKFNMDGVNASPEEIRTGIDSILTLIDTTLSGYNKGSMLSRFNSGETVRPNGLFIRMYSLAHEWYGRSEGAIDCAAGPVFDLWGFGFKGSGEPDTAAIIAAKESSGMARLAPDMASVIDQKGLLAPSALLRTPGPHSPVLNYNAIAQGLTADLVADYLKGLGVKDMLVDIGEIFCCGLNPDRKPWSVGIDRPEDGNITPGAAIEGVWRSKGTPCGIVTSGNYRKFYIREGRKYAHTIDPRTGFPADNGLLSATVVAPDAASADALATWCMVIGPSNARELILSLADVEACLISSSQNDSMSVWTSPGF